MSTMPKPRDRRPEPPATPPAEDKRTELQEAFDDAAEAAATAAQATAEAVHWRIAYEYGIQEEDLDLFLSMPTTMSLIKLAERIGTKHPAPAAPAAQATELTPGDTAN